MYLRWTRFFFFHLTSALCITVTGLASRGLVVGFQKKRLIRQAIPGATLDLKDIFGAGGALTAAAGVASILCLIMNLLGHFRPRQAETKRTIMFKEGAFAFACVFWIAALIPATYIMATKSGKVSRPGTPSAVLQQIIAFSGEKLAYKDQPIVLAYTIVGWIAFLSTFINLVLVSLAARHAHKYGFDGTTVGAALGHKDVKVGLDDQKHHSIEKGHEEGRV